MKSQWKFQVNAVLSLWLELYISLQIYTQGLFISVVQWSNANLIISIPTFNAESTDWLYGFEPNRRATGLIRRHDTKIKFCVQLVGWLQEQLPESLQHMVQERQGLGSDCLTSIEEAALNAYTFLSVIKVAIHLLYVEQVSLL